MNRRTLFGAGTAGAVAVGLRAGPHHFTLQEAFMSGSVTID